MEQVEDTSQAESTTIMESVSEEMDQLSFNESMHEERQNLRDERDALKLEVERLKNALRKSYLNAEILVDDDAKTKIYTSLTWDIFHKIFNFTTPSQLRKETFPLIYQLH